ncbi:MAG: hypothetical protein M1820_004616 [Bogoriella megaspora]|nr:MAG: hypothetical protein M1820_004616 [Bogoriella megaspora]
MPSFLSLIFSIAILQKSLASGACLKKRAGDTAFDRVTSEQWQDLNETVDGRLHVGYPWAKPCYSTYNGTTALADPVQCAVVQASYGDESTIADNFGGYMNANWGACQKTAQDCNLNYSNPTDPTAYAPPANCYQGSVPAYYIEVNGVSDVQAGLSFANKTGVPLVVKNTGHDYRGRSSAPDSLALWTHTYQPTINLTRDFVPEGCSAAVGDGVTFGAGQGFDGLYTFAQANNITIVGGTDKTVGAGGGWLNGGGHSVLSNTLGLGVDNALQIKAVLPNGTYVTANRCQNQDIFFALRGGGGSAFGVNLEITTRANPNVELQVAYLTFNQRPNSSDFTDYLSLVISQSDRWATEGWGGVISPVPPNETGLSSSFLMLTPKLTYAEATTSMSPILNFSKSLGSATVAAGVVTMPSFYAAYETFIAPNTEKVDVSIALASRLIPRSLFQSTSGRQQVLDAFTKVANIVSYPGPYQKDPVAASTEAPLQILVTTPINYPSDNTSSETPAWRNSLWHPLSGVLFSNEADTETTNRAFQGAHAISETLKELAPQSGAYQNEADVFQSDEVEAFWGTENYQKLSSIKKELDPTNLLTCWGCIGWEQADSRYDCYPDID